MQSAITESGQIAIPPEIRKRYSLKPGDNLNWVDEGKVIRLVPVRTDLDPIKALRGSGRGEKLTQKLLASRREDKLHG